MNHYDSIGPDIANLHPISREEPDNHLGYVTIFNTLHHVFAIRVSEIGGEQIAYHDPYNRLADALAGDQGYARVVTIPGLPGDYVVYIQPYREG